MGALIGPLVGLTTQLIGGFATMSAANAQAQAQQSAAEANARAFEINAQIAQQNAQAVRDRSKLEQQDEGRTNRFEQAARRVGFLKAGVTLSGSPIMVLEEEARKGFVDEQRILHEGEVEATDFLNQASQNRFQAQVARMQGQNQARTTILGASRSLIR